ncbi:MAG TPA: cell division topological specificity factor MinE [Cellvibrionaceae bacterium]|jgi:cell division topological specificity factor|nr:cell division topological specificity factor MinE [Cellvibrionaceae bacterium]HMW72544.1 cell division topological specificity factor MinE [Cellvibrionaceae bacterium]HMY40535.1 cell division topological specificity factor MinE [Marinagarivorans sp.]HNG61353.1 cell division topological specificity factor MinE [Cellvibrionaceae bacterium]HRH78619.1 cell division topological specificity factor MinE [Cellvibrionaceae bacterium]
MNFFEYFSRKKNTSASIAKERLQIIVAHERNKLKQPDYLPALQRDIMEVLRKYVDIDMTQVEVQLENNGNCAVLELNVTLPE